MKAEHERRVESFGKVQVEEEESIERLTRSRIAEWEKRVDLDDWQNWTSSLLQPTSEIERARFERHKDTSVWLGALKWPTKSYAELSRAFVRSRRERLTPAEVGLPAPARRRTPGLRCEELAALSGVSLSWYTWLEQDRAIKVSRHVLGALSRALRLNAAECEHLYRLAGELPPAQQATPAPNHTSTSATCSPSSNPTRPCSWTSTGTSSAGTVPRPRSSPTSARPHPSDATWSGWSSAGRPSATYSPIGNSRPSQYSPNSGPRPTSILPTPDSPRSSTTCGRTSRTSPNGGPDTTSAPTGWPSSTSTTPRSGG